MASPKRQPFTSAEAHKLMPFPMDLQQVCRDLEGLERLNAIHVELQQDVHRQLEELRQSQNRFSF